MSSDLHIMSSEHPMDDMSGQIPHISAEEESFQVSQLKCNDQVQSAGETDLRAMYKTWCGNEHF